MKDIWGIFVWALKRIINHRNKKRRREEVKKRSKGELR
jgi:hypothetical protein